MIIPNQITIERAEEFGQAAAAAWTGDDAQRPPRGPRTTKWSSALCGDAQRAVQAEPSGPQEADARVGENVTPSPLRLTFPDTNSNSTNAIPETARANQHIIMNHQHDAPLEGPITATPPLTAANLAAQLAAAVEESNSFSVTPIVNFLNAKFAPGSLDEFLLEQVDFFRHSNQRPRIELPDNILDRERAMQAVVTLLKVTGSGFWLNHKNPEPAEIPGPIRFILEKSSAGTGEGWLWARFLVLHLDGTVDEAKRQQAALIAHLSDDRNLVELGPEERALF